MLSTTCFSAPVIVILSNYCKAQAIRIEDSTKLKTFLFKFIFIRYRGKGENHTMLSDRFVKFNNGHEYPILGMGTWQVMD